METTVGRLKQCCGSGMIYSGSGSSSEFSEFRIHADPDPTRVIWVYLEIVNTSRLNSIIKKNLSTICHFIFHTTVLQYTKSRIRRENTFLLVCTFIFNWIRIRNNNSGSRQKFRIHADPDPQHWLKATVKFGFCGFCCAKLNKSFFIVRFPICNLFFYFPAGS